MDAIANVRELGGPPGPQRWFFDTWSWFYDLPLIQAATYWPVHDAVLGALAEARSKSVLDIGCGTGQLTARIRETLPAARVVGCDFSHGMLRHARPRSADIGWIQGDAARLPLQDGTFDAVVSTEAFHWFPDQDAALGELFRVLSPGGRLLLALVNSRSRGVARAVYAGSRLIGEPFYWPTRDEMRARVEAAGFELLRQRRIFRIPGGVLMPPVLTEAVRPG
jgi:ubiquinone/menaquinone biosynthesis C-methylase UbiE